MISILNKKSKEHVERSTIDVLKERLWKDIQKENDNGIDLFSAYEEVLENYELEEEVIITYEIEAEKVGLINSLDLKSDEIKNLEERLKKALFNKVLTEVKSKK